jgi:hypothetical protein
LPKGFYQRKPKDPMPRFWAKVQKTDGCWVWTGCKMKGYGQFGYCRRNVLAHRFSYAQAYGPIEAHMMVCHRCDNPSCVRPDHLFLGTQKDNLDDCAAKGRTNRVRGERHRCAILTEKQVLQIRSRVSERRVDLAKEFGVSPEAISGIINGRKWRHVQESNHVSR